MERRRNGKWVEYETVKRLTKALSSLPASPAASEATPVNRRNELLAVFYESDLLVLIGGLPEVYHLPAVLDWYAKEYAFERHKLGARPVAIIQYDALAQAEKPPATEQTAKTTGE